MNYDNLVFGHKAMPRDIYQAALWISSTALVFLGLSLIMLNLDIGLIFLPFSIVVAIVVLFLRPDLNAPVSGVVFKKFELLMFAVIGLVAWIFISVFWFRTIWAVFVSVLIMGLIALILWLPGFVGRGADPEADERLRKLDAFSSADSFNVMFVFIALVFILGFFRMITIDLRQALTILMLLAIFVKSISLAYYYRRG
jgi:hypothetical protein